MDTRNGLIDRPPATPAPDSQALAAALAGLRLLATRPAVPGLALVAALLVAAMAGWTLTSAAWFWPSCAGLALSTMVIGTLRQDLWRHLQTRRHRQRIDTAHHLLSQRPAAAER
jgi:membrane protein implicated in regulation of membrane protease activity